MRKDSRERLFEVMRKVNADFIIKEDFDSNEYEEFDYTREFDPSIKRYTVSDFPELDLNKKYDVGNGVKPNGLWYGLEDSWFKFAREELGGHGDYIFELNIDFSNIIVLVRYEDGINFFKKYGRGNDEIDWYKVSRDYKGIEIFNYETVKTGSDDSTWIDPRSQPENVWMSGWDVDSGCIWNLSAINGFEKIEL